MPERWFRSGARRLRPLGAGTRGRLLQPQSGRRPGRPAHHVRARSCPGLC